MELSKEIKKELILELLEIGGEKETEESTTPQPYLGKICMIRTYSAGVHFGTVIYKKGKIVHLKKARRVFSWVSAASLSQLAMEGDKRIEDAKITMPVDFIELTEVIEIIPMKDKAVENLESVVWKK